MLSDEQQIRDLVTTWHDATKAGDAGTVLTLMTDDAVFLVAGRPPMTKQDFATAVNAPPDQPRPTFDGRSEIQEVVVSGDWAYMWTKLSVTTRPPDGPAIERAGHTLSVLRKVDGRWLLARDANLLAPVNKT